MNQYDQSSVFFSASKTICSKKAACHSVKISILFNKQNKLVRWNNADWFTENNKNHYVPVVLFYSVLFHKTPKIIYNWYM